MPNQDRTPTFHVTSPLRAGARLAVLAAVCITLTAGFVASLEGPAAGGAHQVARAQPACAASHAC